MVLFSGVFLLLGISYFRPGYKYGWLLSSIIVLITWVLVLLARTQIPALIYMGKWQPERFFPVSPSLILDGVGWVYALLIATLLLAVIFCDTIRSVKVDLLTLAGSMAISALAILAVMSANQITLLIAWAAIDMIELALWLSHVYDNSTRVRIVITFSMRVIGLMLVFLGGVNPIFLIIAVGLRLGMLPIHLPVMETETMRRGLGTIMRLSNALASLILIIRLNMPIEAGFNTSILLVGFWLVSVYAGLGWLIARDELEGRIFWIAGIGALAVASLVRGQPLAGYVWGITMISAGGVLMLYSYRNRWLSILPWMALLGSLTLPFTPSRDAANLYAEPISVWTWAFILPQCLLYIGYIRHLTSKGEPFKPRDRLVWIVYPLGLALSPLIQYMITYMGWQQITEPAFGQVGGLSLRSVAAWSGIIIIGLMGILMLLRQIIYFKKNRYGLIRRLMMINYEKFFIGVVTLFRWMGTMIASISRVIEGEAGFVWTLVFLALLLIFFSQGGIGR
jgi:hypothetical protein